MLLVAIYEGLRTAYEGELRRLSLKDALTGAWNRRKFEQTLAEEIMRSRRFRRPLSLIVFDVDYFKQINDQFGHDKGDAVLQEIVGCCHAATRSTDLLARLGGDEFTVLMPETSADAAPDGRPAGGGGVAVAERIRTAVARLSIGTNEIKPTITLGVAQLSELDDAARLKRRADGALYVAKRGGRNRLHVAEEETPLKVAEASGPRH